MIQSLEDEFPWSTHIKRYKTEVFHGKNGQVILAQVPIEPPRNDMTLSFVGTGLHLIVEPPTVPVDVEILVSKIGMQLKETIQPRHGNFGTYEIAPIVWNLPNGTHEVIIKPDKPLRVMGYEVITPDGQNSRHTINPVNL